MVGDNVPGTDLEDNGLRTAHVVDMVLEDMLMVVDMVE